MSPVAMATEGLHSLTPLGISITKPAAFAHDTVALKSLRKFNLAVEPMWSPIR